MQALLCAGAGRSRRSDRGCTPVPGAEAVYFGADQPRITAEMLIPWSALGIAPPAPGAGAPRRSGGHLMGPRALDVVVRAARPRRRCADPSGWRKMRLGDGARLIEGTPVLPTHIHG